MTCQTNGDFRGREIIDRVAIMHQRHLEDLHDQAAAAAAGVHAHRQAMEAARERRIVLMRADKPSRMARLAQMWDKVADFFARK